MNKQILGTIAALAVSLPLCGWAAWPEKPIRMVVPYAAGGGADITARIVTQEMSAVLGQPIVLDYKPGAGGVIGADAVAKSAADGYTVLYDASAFSVNPSLYKLPFDAAKDFIPVSLVATAPQVLLVPAAAPYKTVPEMLDFARKNPGAFNFASAGSGSGSHLAAEAFNQQVKLNVVHVPYKGGAPAITDLMGERVSMYFSNVAFSLSYIKGGKVRAIGVTSPKRLALLPEVPTLAEQGLLGFNTSEWNGVFLPKGTPPDVVERLAKALQSALTDPKVKEKLLQLGLQPGSTTPEEFSKFVQDETSRAHALVKARNIKVD
jgi:tripartite-type tricarboxylate transporter receptor subunit TctC